MIGEAMGLIRSTSAAAYSPTWVRGRMKERAPGANPSSKQLPWLRHPCATTSHGCCTSLHLPAVRLWRSPLPASVRGHMHARRRRIHGCAHFKKRAAQVPLPDWLLLRRSPHAPWMTSLFSCEARETIHAGENTQSRGKHTRAKDEEGSWEEGKEGAHAVGHFHFRIYQVSEQGVPLVQTSITVEPRRASSRANGHWWPRESVHCRAATARTCRIHRCAASGGTGCCSAG